ncbi:hypothetical protein I302_102525 [Kwoniella bestiolae CBS 10118]|uniref:Uncharacterized protein n=1 Tax=Kwoniella bestiolae CBS 10118 TaxID=1296100 RepID=A0A1B9GF80_9TREE|nr:hypothetical protein I302_01215 [Kwoniella bestiolae CBS 10118]OCF29703.1 hypothetical protein I302_01215 [Kwoniella bestiolae CBS 10118]
MDGRDLGVDELHDFAGVTVQQETDWNQFDPNNLATPRSHTEERFVYSKKSNFHADCHNYMPRVTNPGATFPIPQILDGILSHMNQQGLGQCYYICGASEGDLHQHSTHNNSIKRQKTFLHGLLPLAAQKIELNQVSVFRDGSSVIDQLNADLDNSLVAAVSIHRLARNARSWNQPQEISQKKNLHVICFLFPPEHFRTISNQPNPIIDSIHIATLLTHRFVEEVTTDPMALLWLGVPPLLRLS